VYSSDAALSAAAFEVDIDKAVGNAQCTRGAAGDGMQSREQGAGAGPL